MTDTNPPTLPDDIEQLKTLLAEKEKQISQQQKALQEKDQSLKQSEQTVQQKQSRIELLEQQVRLFRIKQFGKSSEKHPAQAELFDEAEEEALVGAPEQASSIEAAAENNKTDRARPGRKPLPDHLPRVRIEHDLPEAEKVCACGCQKKHMGEDTSEQLDIVPAKVQVLVHARQKYACPNCEGEVALAPLPPQPIPKSNASPGLLAHLATAKYQDGLPLYRMENIFQRMGIHLPRNTLANWMIKCSELLQPLYNLMQDQLLQSGYIHMDETTVQVLNEPDKPPESKSYMWVRKTADPTCPIVLFDYADSRSAAVVEQLLPDYQGALQTDDYAAYHTFGKQDDIAHLGCWAHARRKFIEAQKSLPKKNKTKTSKADMALNMIQGLYALERKVKDKTPEEKYLARQLEAKPKLEVLKSWLDKSVQQTTPKSKTGAALKYLSNNWDKLVRYIEDGRYHIDNNPVENAIRPFAIGRKNWLFSNSQAGAKASAMLYSIIETAKANELEPYKYLKALFTRLPAVNSLARIFHQNHFADSKTALNADNKGTTPTIFSTTKP